MRRALALAICVLAISGCQQKEDERPYTAQDFPQPYRPVSPPDKGSFASERTRDDRREAVTVMDLAKIEPGMTVADIGAGEGYYTVRLARRVGEQGRVLAEDIDPAALRALGNRVERERFDNVAIKLGAPDDPRLPPDSFDRIFIVHVYHEIAEPYAFLWNMRPALRAGGQVILVDVDKPADEHGIDPRLVFCEFAQVGFRLVEFVRKPEIAGYYAQFEAVGPRPRPRDMRPCVMTGDTKQNRSL